MSEHSISANAKPIWTPDDYRQTVADTLAADQAEFDADLAYIRGLANAILEYGTPAALMRIASKDAL